MTDKLSRPRNILVVTALVFSAFITPFLKTSTANAWTGTLAECTSKEKFSAQWNEWDKWLREPNSSSTPQNPLFLQNFDANNQNYVLFAQDFSPNPERYRIAVSESGKMNFGSDTTGHYITADANWQVYQFSDPINSPSLPDADRWANSPSASYTAGTKLYSVHCVVGGVNVKYQSTYTGQMFDTDVPNSGAAQASCDTLDIACHLANVWRGVTDTFLSVGKAIVNGIAAIFIPSEEYMNQMSGNIVDFWETKLGFLTYPITFIVSVIDAFTDTSNNWCTAGSCTKSFGNMMGSGFSINFAGIENNWPSLWTLIRTIIIGITIFTLMLAIRRKALELFTQ